VRYFTNLSAQNLSVDTGFYPLGSCTMKYSPRVNEEAARMPGFARLHPRQPAATTQGALQLLHELQGFLTEITGMDAASLAPSAGAHGEFTGMLLFRAYHASLGQAERRQVLVPDSAHGTNPASAAMAGFEVVEVRSDAQGNMDLDHLRSLLSDRVAGIMLTMPTTLGLFDPNTVEVCRLVHEVGGLVYGDGANMNALVGRARLGDMGFDVMHLNLHKTFSTPHGGGGPGAGPICVKEFLAPFLPTPVVDQRDEGYILRSPERSVGAIGSFYGNFGVLVRAYAYIRTLGAEGLREVSENAVLNANYVLARLRDVYHLPYDRSCMHEVVFSASRQRRQGVRALDIAKRLLDHGFYAPTIYFPLIVEEAMMIEPTETESLETIDSFIEAMRAIARETEEEPETVRGAPYNTPVGRLDEARAARRPDLRWQAPS
jgi:glycine dehydrogenase subunit 2